MTATRDGIAGQAEGMLPSERIISTPSFVRHMQMLSDSEFLVWVADNQVQSYTRDRLAHIAVRVSSQGEGHGAQGEPETPIKTGHETPLVLPLKTLKRSLYMTETSSDTAVEELKTALEGFIDQAIGALT